MTADPLTAFAAFVGALACLAAVPAIWLALLAFGDRPGRDWVREITFPVALFGAFFGSLFLLVAGAVAIRDVARAVWRAM